MKTEPQSNSYVYKPDNALLNFETDDMEPPEVIYEDRKEIFDENQLEKVIGGKRNFNEKKD